MKWQLFSAANPGLFSNRSTVNGLPRRAHGGGKRAQTPAHKAPCVFNRHKQGIGTGQVSLPACSSVTVWYSCTS
jgi:hypothetical protein